MESLVTQTERSTMGTCPFRPQSAEVLKNSTKELHDAAESHSFQKALATGRMPKVAYADFLHQLHAIHVGFERLLGSIETSDPAIAEIASEKRHKAHKLARDLEAIGEATDRMMLLPATTDLCEFLQECNLSEPFELIGAWYVLEGATNGNKYIARNVIRSMGFAPGVGVAFLDAYGEQQPELWQGFKTALNQMRGDAQSRLRLVNGANKMFGAFHQLSDELWSRYGASIESMSNKSGEARSHAGHHAHAATA